ncbi:daptide-type RiPP biosynthesis dehydogenase [Streptomyces chrestomyceticus]|uniref:daptide-type RiPP biosynthesis dehydogenase n=1 Tax=Streptomyces chrestomyceticus TaxID=68185 RepID=UPI0033E42355
MHPGRPERACRGYWDEAVSNDTGAATSVLHGCATFGRWLGRRAERRITVLVDSALKDSDIVTTARGLVESPGRQVDFVALTGAGDVQSVIALADRLADSELVIGIGGGSLLDQVKLATVARDDRDARTRLTVSQRSGLIFLPEFTGRKTPLVSIPTTLGTGTEVSGVACLAHPGGKRLVLGMALQPEVAVLDAAATATLPGELLAEGVLEALFRVVSPYIGDLRAAPTEDMLVEAVAERLVGLGHALAAVRSADPSGVVADDALRLEIAKVSGFSHNAWLHHGREPYAVKGWLLANELSWTLRVRKMTAVAALLPPLWQAIADGESRLGSAARLRQMWERLRMVGPQRLPADPGAGVRALVDAWRIERRLTADTALLDTVAQRTVRAWGAGLPMLGGQGAGDVRRLLSNAVPESCK